jgi:hypothetical protein
MPHKRVPYFDRFVLVLILITLVSAVGLNVNPWPRDGWYQSQYFLFGSYPGQDNYTPIAAPAVFYWLVHRLAISVRLDLAGEFYLASICQNLLILASACCVYFAGRLIENGRIAGVIAIGFLLLVTSTGLPQAFWSESVVLFLMAIVVLIVVVLLRRNTMSNVQFVSLTLLCAVSIGSLVLTRVTPIFLIPGFAWLFWRRMPAPRVVFLLVTITFATALIMTGAMSANYKRFGRFEITNSAGRHLWQGVKSFSDSALANSPGYRALKRLDPNIQDKDWWNLPLDVNGPAADPREPLLKALAKEAISRKPGRYLFCGVRNFVTGIGTVPYRLGYGARNKHWNPLNRNDLLPSLIELASGSNRRIGPTAARVVDRSFSMIYQGIVWIYPATVFTILMSYGFMCIERINGPLSTRGRGRMAPFLLGGIFLICIVVSGLGLTSDALIASGMCLLPLSAMAKVTRPLPSEPMMTMAFQLRPRRADCALYSFLALMFFGTLWFSWQVEAKNSRNVIPYLPFWALMLVMAISDWKSRCEKGLQPASA